MKVTLKPLLYDINGHNGKRYQGVANVLLVWDGVPTSMLHIDMMTGELHERLCAGETVEAELIIEIPISKGE